jgi:hypothetical protein
MLESIATTFVIVGVAVLVFGVFFLIGRGS